jgi:enoyl-CoA hydratase/carnithine racemase
MTSKVLRVTAAAGVATVVIDHPPSNLVDAAFIGALWGLLDAAERDESLRVLVFTSADPDFFLMHGDVEAILSMPAGAAAPATEPNVAAALFERLAASRLVSIGVLDGAARGGGAEFVSALDLRYGSPRALLGQPEVPMGILPGAGGTSRLPRLLGRSKAIELILTGRDVAADEALALGWLDAVVPREEVAAHAARVARRIAAMPPASIAAVKRVVDVSLGGLRDALVAETDAFARLVAAGAHRAPMRRFLAAGGQTRAGETVQMAEIVDAMLAGRERSGEDPFAAHFEAFLASLREDAALTPQGQEATHAEIARLLRNRLEIAQCLAEHPEILHEPIEAPVFLMGLPRSGTTFLHHLFDHDARFRLLRAWETLRPCPPPAVDPASVAERVAQARHFLGGWKADVVNFDAIHLMDPEGPDECSLLLNLAFAQAGFLNYLDVPGYFRWLLAHGDFLATYRFHKSVLQLLQWGAAPRRWVLKYPNHLLAMREIGAVHPRARFVVTHRDPVQALASLCDLTFQYRAPRHARNDKQQIGRQLQEFVRAHIERLMAYAERPDAGRPVIDVDYYRLVEDPLASVAGIYAALDLEMPRTVRDTLSEWVRRNPKGQRGEHRYRLEEFGLDAGSVNESFAAYRKRYAIPLESAL